MKYELHNKEANIQAMVDVMITELKRIDPKYENIEPHILNTLTQNYIHQIKATGNSEFENILKQTLNIEIPEDDDSNKISIQEV